MFTWPVEPHGLSLKLCYPILFAECRPEKHLRFRLSIDSILDWLASSSSPCTVTHTCFYMKRGEKPEGHRQMRPKTIPSSNSSGNSQQMLQEIRNSLRNLSKPSDPSKSDFSCAGKKHPEDLRVQGRSSNPKHPYHKALQEIRKSLMPFANEPCTTGPEASKQMFPDPPFVGSEEVRLVDCLLWGRMWKIPILFIAAS